MSAGETFSRRLAENLRALGDRVAVTAGRDAMTYRELDAASRAVASQLAARGVGRGDRVGCAFGKAVGFAATFVASLRLGATFCPLDPSQGAAFAAGVARAGDVKVVVAPAGTRLEGVEVFEADLAARAHAPLAGDWVEREHPVNIIFTSGSTGRPKGVMVTEANITHYIGSLSRLLGFGARAGGATSFGFVSSVGADLGQTAFFGALWSGGTLHFAADGADRDPALFRAWVAERAIDVLKITPSHFRAVLGDAPDAGLLGRPFGHLIFGGESLDGALVGRLLRGGVAKAVVNHYGPTETTVGVFCSVWTAENVGELGPGSVPIGRPIGATTFALVPVDAEAPPGDGELFIGGPSVTDGYFRDPDQTAAKFVLRSAEGGAPTRMYRTGDRCRLTPSGLLAFEGRIDRQVKVAGFRVEPEAIERTLAAHAGVSRAAVWVRQTKAGPRLVAAVEAGADVADDAVAALLAGHLPAAAMPRSIHRVDAMPLTSNGKVDYRRLEAMTLPAIGPAPRDDADPPAGAGVGDRAGLNRAVEQVLADLLASPVDASRSFFAQGGDSLSAVMAVNALQRLGLPVDASLVFGAATVAELCDVAWGRLQGGAEAAPEAPPRAADLRYSAMQDWFFAHHPAAPAWWNQAILLRCSGVLDRPAIEAALARTTARHGVFRLRYRPDGVEDLGEGGSTAPPVRAFEFATLDAFDGALPAIARDVHTSLRPGDGVTIAFAVAFVAGADTTFVLAAAHHLAVDGVSWRILADELCEEYAAAVQGKAEPPRRAELVFFDEPAPPPPGAPERLLPLERRGRPLRADDAGANTEASSASWSLCFSEAATHAFSLEQGALETWLLACFADALIEWSSLDGLWVDVEHNGRPLRTGSPHLSAAVGWFTSVTPLWFEGKEGLEGAALRGGDALKRLRDDPQFYTREHLRARRPGADAGEGAVDHRRPEVVFNFLGRFRSPMLARAGWALDDRYVGPTRDPSSDRTYALKLTGRVVDERLIVEVGYSRNRHRPDTVRRLAVGLRERLLDVMESFVRLDAEGRAVSLCHEDVSSSGLMVYRPRSAASPTAASAVGPPGALGVRAPRDPAGVLLTGATGFVGGHLLGELLDRTTAVIWCLVRARSEGEGLERIAAGLAHHRPDIDGARLRRVRPLLGDVGAEGLGLDAATRARLEAGVNDVFHAAANVALFSPPDAYERDNVRGTAHVIEFVRRCDDARLHYISTLAVAGVNPGGAVRRFGEEDFAFGQGFLSPYEKSKFEAESIVRSFREQGGRATAYRTGNVAAHSASGVFQRNLQDNRVYQTWRAFVELGFAPEPAEPIVLSSVDTVAAGVVRLALAGDDGFAAHHVESQDAVPFGRIAAAFRAEGMPFELVPFDAFERRVRGLAARGDPAAALASLWVLERAARPRHVAIDCSRTALLLRRLGVAFREPSDAWLRALVRHCVEVGFLRPRALKQKTAGDARRGHTR